MHSHAIAETELVPIIEKACTAALDGGREICGLIFADAGLLQLRQVRNKVKRGGSFAFYVGEVREAVEQIECQGGIVVGTFHSHPMGMARPGKNDIAYAVDDSLMMIIDCMSREALLWRILGRKARAVRLNVIERSSHSKDLRMPNKAMDRNLHPRHANCLRTCRAAGSDPVMADVRLDPSSTVAGVLTSSTPRQRRGPDAPS